MLIKPSELWPIWGATTLLRYLGDVIAAFPHGVPRDLSERNKVLENLPASVDVEFENADREFYKLDADQFLLRRLKDFWQAQ